MKNLAVIPARGGSKRIPHKNIKSFLGKPIIAYSIEAALSSGLFDEVMVSTDDEEISEISQSYGAEVPFLRSSANADDHATLSDVIEEVKGWYRENAGEFDYICCLLPTAPLITRDNLQRGLDLLRQEKADSVRPVVRFSYPIQRALRMIDGKVEMFDPNHLRTRSQDLEVAYHDAGQFYWMQFAKGLTGSFKMGFEIPGLEAHDIDDPDDWTLAELKYRHLNPS